MIRDPKAKQLGMLSIKKGLLSIGKHMIKAKPQDKYLGDILNEGGLAQSMKEMANDRYGKAFNTIKEI